MIVKPPYAIVDLETTSLDPQQARILEIGLWIIRDDELTFPDSRLVYSNEPVPKIVTKVTGITTEIAQGETTQDLPTALDWLHSLVGAKMPILGHNILRYDIPILRNECKREKHPLGPALYESRLSDTAGLFKAQRLGIYPVKGESHQKFLLRVLDTRVYGFKYSLGHCCDTLGIDRSYLEAHRAVGDVTMTYKVFQRLQEEEART